MCYLKNFSLGVNVCAFMCNREQNVNTRGQYLFALPEYEPVSIQSVVRAHTHILMVRFEADPQFWLDCPPDQSAQKV